MKPKIGIPIGYELYYEDVSVSATYRTREELEEWYRLIRNSVRSEFSIKTILKYENETPA